MSQLIAVCSNGTVAVGQKFQEQSELVQSLKKVFGTLDDSQEIEFLNYEDSVVRTANSWAEGHDALAGASKLAPLISFAMFAEMHDLVGDCFKRLRQLIRHNSPDASYPRVPQEVLNDVLSLSSLERKTLLHEIDFFDIFGDIFWKHDHGSASVMMDHLYSLHARNILPTVKNADLEDPESVYRKLIRTRKGLASSWPKLFRSGSEYHDIKKCEFSADYKYFLLVDYDYNMFVWDLQGEEPKKCLQYNNTVTAAFAATSLFTLDGMSDVREYVGMKDEDREFHGIKARFGEEFVVSSKYVGLTGFGGRKAKLWQHPTEDQEVDLPDRCLALVDGDLLFYEENSKVYKSRLRRGDRAEEIMTAFRPTIGFVVSVHFNAIHDLLIIAFEGAFNVFRQGKQVYEVLFDEEFWIETASLSPNGQFFAASSRGQCKIWDCLHGYKNLPALGLRCFSAEMAWSPDSKFLAFAGSRSAHIFSIEDSLV